MRYTQKPVETWQAIQQIVPKSRLFNSESLVTFGLQSLHWRLQKWHIWPSKAAGRLLMGSTGLLTWSNLESSPRRILKYMEPAEWSQVWGSVMRVNCSTDATTGRFFKWQNYLSTKSVNQWLASVQTRTKKWCLSLNLHHADAHTQIYIWC